VRRDNILLDTAAASPESAHGGGAGSVAAVRQAWPRRRPTTAGMQGPGSSWVNLCRLCDTQALVSPLHEYHGYRRGDIGPFVSHPPIVPTLARGLLVKWHFFAIFFGILEQRENSKFFERKRYKILELQNLFWNFVPNFCTSSFFYHTPNYHWRQIAATGKQF
jgi:hypothetical protein